MDLESEEPKQRGGVSKVANRAKWFVTELVVIVAGVLTALGIDAWYDKRIEARDERIYLEQLIEDLNETERLFCTNMDQNLEAIKSTTKLLKAFSLEDYPPNDSIKIWLSKVEYLNNPVPILGTAEALIASGDLRLIHNAESRASITRWLSRSRDFWLIPLYQLEDQHRTNYFELMEYVDAMALQTNDSLYGFFPPDKSPFPFNPNQFFQEHHVYSLLTNLYKLKESMERFQDDMCLDATNLRSLIEANMD